ncbi:Mobile element protein [Methanosarcina siciliae HI350]|uniref:Mobile element protein n=1 Tax=Methanosarcina siciliae HI350 TaxID=1434119 RepID=A0A0E3LB08_9EURY|nr:Mobile element protein [Methanosarcina siciliae HI350]
MAGIINKACGLDIHNKFLIATILSIFGEKKQLRFKRTEKGILDLKNWVISEKCDVVACESTSDFWVPIYESLINYLTVIVGNARDMKAFTHKKTDNIDSEFIQIIYSPSSQTCAKKDRYKKCGSCNSCL